MPDQATDLPPSLPPATLFDVPHPPVTRRRQAVRLTLALLSGVILLAGWYAVAGLLVDWATGQDIDSFALRSRDSADQIATNLARNLQDEVRRLGNLPEVFTADASLRAPLLAAPLDPGRAALVAAANMRLHQVALQVDADLLYLVDANGLCIAASNYQSSDSVIGIDLHSRQYFAAIQNGGRGRQFAFGTGTGVPGVYFSAAIRVDGRFVGGVVVKRAIRSLFRLTTRNAVLLVDEFGVVVASSDDQALWHTLPDATAAGLGSDFLMDRYRQPSLAAIDLRPDDSSDAVSLVHLFDDPVPSLMTARPIGDSGLRLIYFTPLPDLLKMRQRASLAFWLVFGSGSLLLLFLSGIVAAVLQSRNRVQSLRRRTRQLSLLSEELAAEKEAALAADRAKARFLATMSHELRTPFTGILGVVDLLRASPLPRLAAQQVELLERSARSLLGLLNDVLDFSRVDAGQVRLDQVPFALAPVLDDLGAIHQAVAAAKGISLTVSRPPAPLIGLGDPNRLRQILTNFLSNAIKFTTLGGVQMTAALQGDGAARRLRVTVNDSGPGIPRDSQAQLFEPFFQADSAITRKQGGAGLGLAIARRIARAMGGEVGVDSEAGFGASFWLDMPFPETSLPPVSTEPATDAGIWLAEPGPGRQILLADDDEVSRLVIGSMLRQAGHRVSVVADGRQALQALAAGDYDLIVMDMHMPDLDGSEATRLVRELGDGKGTLPVLGLTADVVAENRQQYLQAGLDLLLDKPINAAELLAAVKRLTGTDSTAV